VDRSADDNDRTFLANLYLGRMERDPVLQAIGRVRPLTHAREVVTFQMADFTPELGEVTEVRTLSALRRVLGVQDPKEIDREFDLAAIQAAKADGLSTTLAAERAGMSRATAYRRVQEADRLKNPSRDISCREIETNGGTRGEQ
jgi:hypothetical protein